VLGKKVDLDKLLDKLRRIQKNSENSIEQLKRLAQDFMSQFTPELLHEERRIQEI
jgi:hypothetical protein